MPRAIGSRPIHIAEMKRLTTERIRAGALGVRTSRNFGHRFKDGRLAPSVPTEDEEIRALAEGPQCRHRRVPIAPKLRHGVHRALRPR